MTRIVLTIDIYNIVIRVFIEKITNHNKIYTLFQNKIKQTSMTHSLLR